MSRTSELAGFAALAVLLHLAGAVFLAGREPATGAPAGAEARVALAPADDALRALVKAWTAPPPAAPAPPAPEPAAASPAPPAAAAVAARPDRPGLATPPTDRPPPAPSAAPAEPVATPRPQPRPEPPTAAQAEPEPATSAAPAAARTSAPPSEGAAEPTDLARLAEAHAAAVRVAIARAQRFPRRALQRGERGTALLRLTLDRSGTLRGLGLLRSSGSGLLDEAALAAARSAAYPAAAPALDQPSFTYDVGVVFDPG